MQIQKQGRFGNHHQELCPDRARAALTMGRMMFEFEPAGNGEGLENRVLACIVLYSEPADKSGFIGRTGRDVKLPPHG